ncbi:MAG: cardiolipin synthase [Bacillota bacterium]|jgi:cardiolipin synthase
MRKHWLFELYSRRTFVALLIILQVIFLVATIINTSRQSELINVALNLLSLLVALYVISRPDNRPYRLMWTVLLLAFPIFGGLFYLLFSSQSFVRLLGQREAAIDHSARHLLRQDNDVLASLAQRSPEIVPQARYLARTAGFPLYRNTRVRYLTPGERMWEVLLAELEKAEKYILLEFFIISPGRMLDSILNVLRLKAEQGVEVRLIYDDLGCFLRLPSDFPQRLAALGLKAAVFNPFRPVLSTLQNNRDHRKIVVIDGKVAFTGGVNIGDEYINADNRPVHWKDAAVMLQGDAAWGLTMMFLKMWSLIQNEAVDFQRYQPSDASAAIFDDGFVQPYADSPLDKENVGEHVYLQIINRAQKYVYINTPYLILDDVMLEALRLAAKSGVDVRIVTPYHWDKRLVHITTRSYYRELLAAGVRIYEYTDGFMHSKTFVADDETATVGTTNLDYRSLYLHFECGVWLHQSQAVREIKDDFLQTLKRCQQITLEETERHALARLGQQILRLFAPLL